MKTQITILLCAVAVAVSGQTSADRTSYKPKMDGVTNGHTVESALDERLSISLFGASPTASADVNDAAFARAIAAAGVGRSVYVPAGPTQGSGATATVSVASGAVTGVTMARGGSGYIPGSTAFIYFSGVGTGAFATVVADGSGSLSGAVTVAMGGSGYASAPRPVFVPAHACYALSQSIALFSDVRLLGDGYASCLSVSGLGGGYVIDAGLPGRRNYNIEVSHLAILSGDNTTSGVRISSTDRFVLSNLYIEGNGASSTGVSSIGLNIDGNTQESIFSSISNVVVNYHKRNAVIQSTGGGNNVTTLSIDNLQVNGNSISGQTGIEILNGNGDGIVFRGGNAEHNDVGIFADGTIGNAAHLAIFDAFRFESNSLDIHLGLYANAFKFINCSGLETVRDDEAGAFYNGHVFLGNRRTITNSVGASLYLPSILPGPLKLQMVDPAEQPLKISVNNTTGTPLSPFFDVSGTSSGVHYFQLDSAGCLSYVGQAATGICSTGASPQNVLARPNGSLALSTSGVAGRSLWVKENSKGGTVSSIATPQSVISGITQANPAVVYAVGHPFVTGESVYFAGVVGMTQMNGNGGVITVIDADHFSVPLNSSGYTPYMSGGVATATVVYYPSHPFSTSQHVYFVDVAGMTEINSVAVIVKKIDADHFGVAFDGTLAGAYTSGGRVYDDTGWSRAITVDETGTVMLPDPSSGSITYFRNNGSGGSTGGWRFQPGLGSSLFGGGLTLYQAAHATRPGYFVAGIGAVGGKFCVNDSGIDNGTDVLCVDRSGNLSGPHTQNMADGDTPTLAGSLIATHAWVIANAAGTVTHTAGALTGNQLLFGNGGADAKVGDLTGDVTTAGSATTTLAASGVAAGTYGDSGHVAQISIDVKGRVTSAGSVSILTPLAGTSGSIGGAALAAGACASDTALVSGATTGMVADVSPAAGTYPGDGVLWHGYVSSAGTVTVKVCGVVGVTPVSAAYNVRVQ